MATMLEAQPFIEKLGLRPIDDLFDVYGSDDFVLIISGIGKAHAAAATSHIITRYGVKQIYNLGAAGALDEKFKLGDIFQIASTEEIDRIDIRSGETHKLQANADLDLASTSLVTVDTPIKDNRHLHGRGLVDMEGAAVLQTAQTYNIPCRLIKFVSDTYADHNIVNNIQNLRDDFCNTVLDILA